MAETVKNKGQMRDYMRQLYLDIDTVDQALSNGQCDSLLNDWYHSYMYQFDRAVINHDPLVFSTGIKSQTLSPSTELSVHNNIIRVTRATIGNQPLDKIEFDLMLIKQNSSGYGATGTPTEYAVEQVNPGSGNAPQEMTFKINVYPIPSSTVNVVVWTQEVVDDLTTDTDQPRLTAAETNWICRMAAGDAAVLTGADSEFVRMILAPIPQEIQARLYVNQNFTLPRPQRQAKEQS